jgi:two-component system chemotaxis response regulator CheY
MRKILIVDDSPTIRRMVLASLQTIEQVSFREASNGLEAIETLARDHVDLMILDLNMPEMHGLEVLQFVRAHQQYRHLPIIVLSTKYDAESRNAALGSGASRYLTKPFDPSTLKDQALSLLQVP